MKAKCTSYKESFSLSFKTAIPLDRSKDRGPRIYMFPGFSPSYGGQ